MQEIKVHLTPSKQFIFLMLIMMFISIISVSFLNAMFLVKQLLIIIVLIYGSQVLWKYGLLQHKNSIIGLSFNAEGWKVHLPGKVLLAELSGDSTRTKLVSILRFSIAGERLKRSCVIWRDAITQDEYRRLGVIAKWVKSKK